MELFKRPDNEQKDMRGINVILVLMIIHEWEKTNV